MHPKHPIASPTLEATLSALTRLIALEQSRPVNGLTALQTSRGRRAMIETAWQDVQKALAPIRQAIDHLPALPDESSIRWAQGVLALPNLAFMEIDTTGLREEDEIVRFTLLDREGTLIEDVVIRPTRSTLSRDAARANGLTQEALLRQGCTIQSAWERMQIAVTGRYIVSYHQEWDLRQLAKAAQQDSLPPLVLIGSDLQRPAFAYTHREYGVSLASFCERTGYALPDLPAQTALDRARGQRHLVQAMAEAITLLPVQPIAADAPPPASTQDDDGLGESDEHPF